MGEPADHLPTKDTVGSLSNPESRLLSRFLRGQLAQPP